MSRSYRKPWVKDPSNSYMKKIYARAFRRTCRQISHVFKTRWDDDLALYEFFEWEGSPEEDTWSFVKSYKEVDDWGFEPVYPHRRDIINMYAVCDYRFLLHKGYNCGPTWSDETKYYLKACRK